jgi:N-acetylmuramoyl-L-alanine amidase
LLDAAMRRLDQRDEWSSYPAVHVPRHPAEKHLRGLVIVVDPGHGGTDGGDADPRPDYKTGPTGVKEAHMNLRVSLLLERLLTDAGALVVMTRRGDDTIGLAERAAIANGYVHPDGRVGADLFISVHHNAGPPTANYSSVWYHGEVDWSEPDMDVAREIAHQLGWALRTDVAKTSPILSDQLMYDSGFAVLRHCRVPAVLLESSFYTFPPEEQRLKDAFHNLREAYAVYLGLCQWAYNGRPTQQHPVVTLRDAGIEVEIELNDGLPAWWGKDRNRILSSTIRVTWDGKPVSADFTPAAKRIRVRLPTTVGRGESGAGILGVHFCNMLKNSNWPQRYRVSWSADPSGPISVHPIEPIRAGTPSTRPAT